MARKKKARKTRIWVRFSKAIRRRKHKRSATTVKTSKAYRIRKYSRSRRRSQKQINKLVQKYKTGKINPNKLKLRDRRVLQRRGLI